MRDFRTSAKDAFLSAAAPWMRRALNRWVPACPNSTEEWQHAKISYSQFGEDLVVAQLLRSRQRRPETVFYVDIGCWHPIKLSNSFHFYRQGGCGIAVDPNPAVIHEFKKIRSRDTVVQAAISSQNGVAEYCCYEWDEANSLKSSTEAQSGTSVLGQSPNEIITVPTRTLAEILARHVPPDTMIDLLDVDSEGHDLLVLQSNDWNRFQPTVILVEAHGVDRQSATKQYLENHGYELHAMMAWTMVFHSSR